MKVPISLLVYIQKATGGGRVFTKTDRNTAYSHGRLTR